jgi:hypothetical protein
MSDWGESDSAYVRGRVDGFLNGLACSSDKDLAFDQERWEDRYGSRVVYDSFPAWASKAEQKRNEDPVVLCDWVDSSETLYLKDGVNLPLDRSGTIVFENGLVVLSSSGSPQMFTVDEDVVELVEEWRELNLEMLRDSV